MGAGKSTVSERFRRDCKFAGFPFSDGPAAAPHTRTANSTAAGSNNNMEPKPNVPPPSRPTARQPDRRALTGRPTPLITVAPFPAPGHVAPEEAASGFDLGRNHVTVHMAECVHVRTAADVALPAEPDKEDRR